MNDKYPLVTVGALIFNKKNQVLFLKSNKWKEQYGIPAGKLHYGESIINGLKREIKEETGLNFKGKVKDFRIKGKYSYKRKLKDRSGVIGQTFKLFAVEVKKEKKIKADSIEHFKGEWMVFEKALKKLTWSNQRKCLRIVNKWVKENGKI